MAETPIRSIFKTASGLSRLADCRYSPSLGEDPNPDDIRSGVASGWQQLQVGHGYAECDRLSVVACEAVAAPLKDRGAGRAREH